MLRDPAYLEQLTKGAGPSGPSPKQSSKPRATAPSDGPPLLILYGSNTGTCEALAQELLTAAASYGFSAIVKTLDDAVSGLPKKDPVAIITATYEGQPPDNAAHFIEWLKSVDASELKLVRYSVFGVGNN